MHAAASWRRSAQPRSRPPRFSAPPPPRFPPALANRISAAPNPMPRSGNMRAAIAASSSTSTRRMVALSARAMSMRAKWKAGLRARMPALPTCLPGATHRCPDLPKSGDDGLRLEAAEIADGTSRTVGFARLADIAPMQDQPVMRVLPVFGRHDLFEFPLDLDDIFPRR